ncbi:DMT family transporter [Desulfotomaculum sp. 1211_IL3151]|uniref:DMT family transporter n=1 Tax=Desulfotomaculum sp. 1211_IL3151 TaxID=3084055 RepID=UPI002FDA1188
MTKALQMQADLALLAVSFVWGVTFVVVQDALSGIGPYYFIGIRFAIAFAFLALIYGKRFRNIDKATLKAGSFIGVFLFMGYAFQTVGLKYTTASNAGFITGLAVVLVPLFTALITKKIPSLVLIFGVTSATLGLGLLSIGDNLSIRFGDILCFFCAICYAAHIILVGKYAPKHDPVLLAILQVGVVAVISLSFGVARETLPAEFTRPVWTGLLITAIPATALAFLIQNSVQRFTSATHTAIIFITEPVFAAATGWLWAGEVLSPRQWVGCLLILVGMLIAELKDSLTTEAIPKEAKEM